MTTLEISRTAASSPRAQALRAFVDAARGGGDGLWRVALTLLLLFVGINLVALLFGSAVMLAGSAPATPAEQERFILVAALLGLGAAPLLLSGLLPLVQRRPFTTLLGPRRRFDGEHLAIGALAAAAMVTLGTLASWTLGLNRISWVEGYSPPWALIALAAALIPLQSAGEELIFRGYLLQEAARRLDCATPLGVLAWAVAPSALFATLHLGGAGTPVEETLYVASTLAFGLFAAGLVWLSGGISAAIGFHIANNLLSILLFEPPVGVVGLGPIKIDFIPERLWLSALADLVLLAAALAVLSRLLRPRAEPRP